jgi:hypothetical protein
MWAGTVGPYRSRRGTQPRDHGNIPSPTIRPNSVAGGGSSNQDRCASHRRAGMRRGPGARAPIPAMSMRAARAGGVTCRCRIDPSPRRTRQRRGWVNGVGEYSQFAHPWAQVYNKPR